MTENGQSDFDKILDFGNLYKTYKKTKSGKFKSRSILRFTMNALDGLYRIQQSLQSKTYKISPYRQFKVYEPKERIVEAASFKDNIVQNCICDYVIMPQLKDEFVLSNVAGQVGKGTEFGIQLLKKHMLKAYEKYGYDCWIVKGDIKKFFYSIDHDVLQDIVEYFSHDPDIIWLLKKYINSVDSPGVPLGNRLSQVFGLIILSRLDHFIIGELGVEFYGRYSDDFYLIVQNKSYSFYCLDAIKEFIKTLKLELNNKTQIIPFKNGIKYCGFHMYITRDGKYIRKITNARKRLIKKKYKKGAELVHQNKLSLDKFMHSYYSCRSHFSKGNCVKFTYEMDKYINQIINRNS